MTVSLSQEDDGRLIEAAIGETIAVRLAENASTGFRWALDRCDGEVLTPLPEQPEYGGERVGAGGHVTFSFRAARAGKGEIRLKHWRSWEGDKSVSRRFHLKVRVRDRP